MDEMIKRLIICFIILVCMSLTTGCWDEREINDQAIILGWGFDQNEDGDYIGSAQIVVPGEVGEKSSGQGKGYMVETATGKSLLDVSQNLQRKLSRKVFQSHQKVIIIGERLARNGISNILDLYSREPELPIRTNFFVLKNGDALEFMEVEYKMEDMPSTAAMKMFQSTAGPESTTFKDFLEDASSEGISPTLPILEIISSKEREKDTETFRLGGRAIFNQDLESVGFLSYRESVDRLWITNKLNTHKFTTHLVEEKGSVGILGMNFNSKIQPIIQNNQVKFHITLSGTGVVRENNTVLDLKQPKNLQIIERSFNKNLQEHMKSTITKVQKEYKTDILGFGQSVHKKYPGKWKIWKKDWSKKFSDADITVKVEIDIERTGVTGSPLHLKESEIQK
ncbi:Ger(x)C family spore germination protein [Fredinandcohnia sp. QZ13]|uniref:Ger(x)C family spore germination protein n=1 Tax=Fredinandcohnia sp. QZ13 TaxID=3073144 RepID=UPI002852F91F|nr:Ger(x)C family spore germination protein [Fredinandcohnia sp. QZ13]MDR4886287.1 Ger(x)C family spore germination protein [Fredinandcohnia sp. QZ13]